MKTILFLDGSKFKTKVVQNFIESNFDKEEISFLATSKLSMTSSLASSTLDIVIIGDNIDITNISKSPQGYYTPHFIYNYITAVLGYAPKCCLFSNNHDYTLFESTADKLYETCKANYIPYINNLEDDAFTELFDFINAN